MIYIDSKGEEQELSELNDFHLRAAHEKAQRFANAGEAASLSDGDHELARYVRMVQKNLWAEICRRKSLPLSQRFEAAFEGKLLTHDLVVDWLNEQQENL